ncbi:hypothetical protein BDV95DRAFT_493672 [Massariosphaeria phaeospora]|uniref:FAR-17a/AIG1-like protein-domain-containing protein n=1 Tax=Massariosphaeria phaeospora TaxID=100035 RepID=A0A7C8MF09_9PLEO|nr:hypothetical protein BDV95DRAFT_493672 [Massariosphaeria phaeospora]
MGSWGLSSSQNEGRLDPTYRYETSWILPPRLLFFIRALLSLYAFVTLFFIFGWNGSHGMSEESRHSFSYFTHLTYWGLAFYYAFAASHSCSYWLTGTSFLARWPRALQGAHAMLYSTVVVFPWIVTAVFWALLAPSDGFSSPFSLWSNTSQHALNASYALFEIVFPRTEPPAFLQMVPIVVILGLYLGLAYLTLETEGFYVYEFLDPRTNSTGIVAGYIVGILAAAVVVFLIVRYVIVLRLWLTEKKLGMAGKFRSSGKAKMVVGKSPTAQRQSEVAPTNRPSPGLMS